MKSQIINKGYCCIKDEQAFQFIDIHSIQWSERGDIPLQMCVRSRETEEALLHTQIWLAEKYIKPIFCDYTCSYVDLVNGMDDNVYEWHNDYEENQVNLGILLYFSDTDEEIGSGIGFRDPLTHESTGFFYPKTHDVCVINHTTKFEHQVTKQSIPLQRIVASFHYYVNALN
ncbi:hypothetical protein [Lake Baikal phage Baikal-20-5m-C28]|nr:hypothetical protein [Lake Baikal phage Baikal-20-5m-C28]